MWDKVVKAGAGWIIGPYIRSGICVLCHKKFTCIAFVLYITNVYRMEEIAGQMGVIAGPTEVIAGQMEVIAGQMEVIAGNLSLMYWNDKEI
jgi:hypothetical protein